PHVDDPSPEQFRPSKATEGMYDAVKFPWPKTADTRYIEQMPIEVQRSENRRRWAVRFGTPELFQTSMRKYYRLITEVDTQVGLLRQKLKEQDRDRNTIIIFTGDHGFYLGEHGLAGKWFMHEEAIRTPLLVFDPRLPASRRGARVDDVTLNIDFHPTMLAMAGLQAPAGTMGRDFSPLLRGESTPWRREFYYEHNFTNGGWIPSTEGVRATDWKYTLYTDCDPQFEELFDLKNDRLEERNLARQPQQAQKMAAMRTRYHQWQAAIDAWREGQAWREPA
ncbi:MAG: sulfatase/phosphatase domain-containing protein, partial [Acidobacteriota bacterium]